jgi:hypothetical protein
MKYSELKKQLDELHFEGTNIDPEIVFEKSIDGKTETLFGLDHPRIIIREVKRTLDWKQLILRG